MMKYKLNLLFAIIMIIALNATSCNKCEDEDIVTILPIFRNESCEITDDQKENKRCADREMLNYLYSNLDYPQEAKNNMIEGSVWVEFDIDKDGISFNHEVTSGIGYGCDEEALRVVKTFLFLPAKNNCGNEIISHMGVNVRFLL